MESASKPIKTYVEETVKPLSWFGLLLIWGLCGLGVCFLFVSEIDPKTEGFIGFLRLLDFLFVLSVITILLACFTLIFIFFKGLRFRLYDDHLEFERGRKGYFAKTQTKPFEDLTAIDWNLVKKGDEGPYDSTFINFVFSDQQFLFNLHKNISLDSPLALKCREIEREVITTRLFDRLKEYQSNTIEFAIRHIKENPVDNEPIWQLSNESIGLASTKICWSDIRSVTFLMGSRTGCANFLPQCRIRINSAYGIVLENDMPAQNPYAFWKLFTLLLNVKHLIIDHLPQDAG